MIFTYGKSDDEDDEEKDAECYTNRDCRAALCKKIEENTDWLIDYCIRVLLGIKCHVALERNPEQGYTTLVIDPTIYL